MPMHTAFDSQTSKSTTIFMHHSRSAVRTARPGWQSVSSVAMTIIEARLSELRVRIRQEVDQGLLPSCQFAVGLDGDVVAHEAFGDATIDDRYVMFSATKAVVAG